MLPDWGLCLSRCLLLAAASALAALAVRPGHVMKGQEHLKWPGSAVTCLLRVGQLYLRSARAARAAVCATRSRIVVRCSGVLWVVWAGAGELRAVWAVECPALALLRPPGCQRLLTHCCYLRLWLAAGLLPLRCGLGKRTLPCGLASRRVDLRDKARLVTVSLTYQIQHSPPCLVLLSLLDGDVGTQGGSRRKCPEGAAAMGRVLGMRGKQDAAPLLTCLAAVALYAAARAPEGCRFAAAGAYWGGLLRHAP